MSNQLFSNPHWQECSEHFLAHVAPSTRKSYAYRLRQFFADDVPPERKTRTDVERWISAPTAGATRVGRPPSAPTQNSRLRLLKSFYRYASRYQVLFRGKLVPLLRGPAPTDGLREIREPLADRDMQPGEAERLLGVIDRSTPIGARDYCVFATLLVTARRVSEILHLQWKDIEATTFVENGRMRRGWIYRWQGKGHLSVDDCAEWPDACMVILRDYLEKADHWEHLRGEDYLFVSLRANGAWPTRPLTHSAIHQRFCRYAECAGIPRSVVIHSLRHESAWQRHEANGHNIEAVRQDLRHASINTTMRYLHKRRQTQADPVAMQLAAMYVIK